MGCNLSKVACGCGNHIVDRDGKEYCLPSCQSEASIEKAEREILRFKARQHLASRKGHLKARGYKRGKTSADIERDHQAPMKPIKNFLGIGTVEAIFDRLITTVVSGKQVLPSDVASTEKGIHLENKNQAVPEEIVTSGSSLGQSNRGQKEKNVASTENEIHVVSDNDIVSEEIKRSGSSLELCNQENTTDRAAVKKFVSGVLCSALEVVRSEEVNALSQFSQTIEDIDSSGPLEDGSTEESVPMKINHSAVKSFVDGIISRSLDIVKDEKSLEQPTKLEVEEDVTHKEINLDAVSTFIDGIMSRSLGIVRAEKSLEQESVPVAVEEDVAPKNINLNAVRSFVDGIISTSIDVVKAEKFLEPPTTMEVEEDVAPKEIYLDAVSTFVDGIISTSLDIVKAETTLEQSNTPVAVEEDVVPEDMINLDAVNSFVGAIISISLDIVRAEKFLVTRLQEVEVEDTIPAVYATANNTFGDDAANDTELHVKTSGEEEIPVSDTAVIKKDLENPEVLKHDHLSLVLVNWDDVKVTVDAEIKKGPEINDTKDNWEQVGVSEDEQIKVGPQPKEEQFPLTEASAEQNSSVAPTEQEGQSVDLDESDYVMVCWNQVEVTVDKQIKVGPQATEAQVSVTKAPAEQDSCVAPTERDGQSVDLDEGDYVMVNWDQVEVSLDEQIKVGPQATEAQVSVTKAPTEQDSRVELEIQEHTEIKDQTPLNEEVVKETVEDKEDILFTFVKWEDVKFSVDGEIRRGPETQKAIVDEVSIPVKEVAQEEQSVEDNKDSPFTFVKWEDVKLSVDGEIRRVPDVKQEKSRIALEEEETQVDDINMPLALVSREGVKCQVPMKQDIVREQDILEGQEGQKGSKVQKGQGEQEEQEGQVGVRDHEDHQVQEVPEMHQQQFVTESKESVATGGKERAVAMGDTYALADSFDAVPMATASTPREVSEPITIANAEEPANAKIDSNALAIDSCSEDVEPNTAAEGTCSKDTRVNSKNDEIVDDKAQDIEQGMDNNDGTNGQEVDESDLSEEEVEVVLIPEFIPVFIDKGKDPLDHTSRDESTPFEKKEVLALLSTVMTNDDILKIETSDSSSSLEEKRTNEEDVKQQHRPIHNHENRDADSSVVSPNDGRPLAANEGEIARMQENFETPDKSEAHKPKIRKENALVQEPDDCRLSKNAKARQEEGTACVINDVSSSKVDSFIVGPDDCRLSENAETTQKGFTACETSKGETTVARPSDGRLFDTAELEKKVVEFQLINTDATREVTIKGDFVGGPADGRISKGSLEGSRKGETGDSEEDMSVARPSNASFSKTYVSLEFPEQESRRKDSEQENGEIVTVRPDDGNFSSDTTLKYSSISDERVLSTEVETNGSTCNEIGALMVDDIKEKKIEEITAGKPEALQNVHETPRLPQRQKERKIKGSTWNEISFDDYQWKKPVKHPFVTKELHDINSSDKKGKSCEIQGASLYDSVVLRPMGNWSQICAEQEHLRKQRKECPALKNFCKTKESSFAHITARKDDASENDDVVRIQRRKETECSNLNDPSKIEESSVDNRTGRKDNDCGNEDISWSDWVAMSTIGTWGPKPFSPEDYEKSGAKPKIRKKPKKMNKPLTEFTNSRSDDGSDNDDGFKKHRGKEKECPNMNDWVSMSTIGTWGPKPFSPEDYETSGAKPKIKKKKETVNKPLSECTDGKNHNDSENYDGFEKHRRMEKECPNMNDCSKLKETNVDNLTGRKANGSGNEEASWRDWVSMSTIGTWGPKPFSPEDYEKSGAKPKINKKMEMVNQPLSECTDGKNHNGSKNDDGFEKHRRKEKECPNVVDCSKMKEARVDNLTGRKANGSGNEEASWRDWVSMSTIGTWGPKPFSTEDYEKSGAKPKINKKMEMVNKPLSECTDGKNRDGSDNDDGLPKNRRKEKECPNMNDCSKMRESSADNLTGRKDNGSDNEEVSCNEWTTRRTIETRGLKPPSPEDYEKRGGKANIKKETKDDAFQKHSSKESLTLNDSSMMKASSINNLTERKDKDSGNKEVSCNEWTARRTIGTWGPKPPSPKDYEKRGVKPKIKKETKDDDFENDDNNRKQRPKESPTTSMDGMKKNEKTEREVESPSKEPINQSINPPPFKVPAGQLKVEIRQPLTGKVGMASRILYRTESQKIKGDHPVLPTLKSKSVEDVKERSLESLSASLLRFGRRFAGSDTTYEYSRLNTSKGDDSGTAPKHLRLKSHDETLFEKDKSKTKKDVNKIQSECDVEDIKLAIQEFNNVRQVLGLDGPVSTSLVYKFLLAREFDVDDATRLYKSYLSLRRVYYNAELSPLKNPLQQELYSGSFTVLDASGAAIALFTAHLHKQDISHEVALNNIYFQLDEAIKSLEIQRNGIILIYDFSNISYKTCDVHLCSKILELFQSAYPLRVKKTYIVSPPFWFEPEMRLFSASFRDPKKRKNINIVTQSRLKNHLPMTCVPRGLGGECQANPMRLIELCVSSHKERLGLTESKAERSTDGNGRGTVPRDQTGMNVDGEGQ